MTSKVLSFTHAYMGAGHNGGAETTLHDVMRSLRNLGHPTTALVSKPHEDGSGSFILDGVKVQAYASKKDPEYLIPESDVVLTHLGEAARASILARKNRKPVIHLLHNEQDYCVKHAERYADAVVFNSAWIIDAYSSIADRPSVVLHPMVDPLRYKVESTRDYITIVNLTVGQTNRLSYDKGGRTFYEMARRFPDEKFLGVMGGYGDQYIPSDIPPNVTILPHTNNILDVYRKSKLILTPSTYESYGRVAVEAGCSGIPSILSDLPGTHEAMGYSARYCQPNNYNEWEFAIQQVLRNYDDYSWYAQRQAWDNWHRTTKEWNSFLKMFNDLLEV